ncbi:MAG: hypothetical protein WBD42_06945, partial [Methylovirgula sp.]
SPCVPSQAQLRQRQHFTPGFACQFIALSVTTPMFMFYPVVYIGEKTNVLRNFQEFVEIRR